MTKSVKSRKNLEINKTNQQKGGGIDLWYGVLNRAMIPIALLGAFGMYTRKHKKKHNKTKKRTKSKK